MKIEWRGLTKNRAVENQTRENQPQLRKTKYDDDWKKEKREKINELNGWMSQTKSELKDKMKQTRTRKNEERPETKETLCDSLNSFTFELVRLLSHIVFLIAVLKEFFCFLILLARMGCPLFHWDITYFKPFLVSQKRQRIQSEWPRKTSSVENLSEGNNELSLKGMSPSQ